METMQIVIQKDSVVAVQSTVRKCKQMTSSEEHSGSHWGPDKEGS